MCVSAICEDIKPWETRILLLDPRQPEQKLSGKLVRAVLPHRKGAVFSLPEEIERRRYYYTALFHNPDASDKDHTISISGSDIPIGRDLHSLLAFHWAQSKLFMWIDTLCINKEDGTEMGSKNYTQAVALKNASRIAVWRGKDNISAMNTTRAVGSALQDGSDADDEAKMVMQHTRTRSILANWLKDIEEKIDENTSPDEDVVFCSPLPLPSPETLSMDDQDLSLRATLATLAQDQINRGSFD